MEEPIKRANPSGISRMLRNAGFGVKRTGVPRDYPGFDVRKHLNYSVWLSAYAGREGRSAREQEAEAMAEAAAFLREKGHLVSYKPGARYAVIGPAAAASGHTGPPAEQPAEPAPAEPAQEERPGYVKVPGLDVWVKDREDEPPASAPKRRKPKFEFIERWGVYTGKYIIDMPGWGPQCFWIKLEGDPLMRHPVIKLLERRDGEDKWRAWYGGINEVVDQIKAAGWDAAVRYAEDKKRCWNCGRKLTVSAIKGIGPECEQEVGENPFGPNN